jgi:hypothetical protein
MPASNDERLILLSSDSSSMTPCLAALLLLLLGNVRCELPRAEDVVDVVEMLPMDGADEYSTLELEETPRLLESDVLRGVAVVAGTSDGSINGWIIGSDAVLDLGVDIGYFDALLRSSSMNESKRKRPSSAKM